MSNEKKTKAFDSSLITHHSLLRKLRRLLPARPPQTLSSLDAYQRWAATYPPHAHNALMQAEETAMLGMMLPLAGHDVLDLASGTGRYGLIARERGARQVVALDNSPAMLAGNPLSLRALATMTALPLPSASVDVVLCALALGHLPAIDLPIGEIGRVLRPGGWALVSDFHPLIFQRGGRRTFSAGGRTYAVEHYAHQDDDYRRAAHEAGLVIEAVQEPRHESQPDVPVVIVYRMKKG